MNKKIFSVYITGANLPRNDASASLDLPASPWELWDAAEKAQLLNGEKMSLEIENYYAFDNLAPHLEDLNFDLMELNDLAGRLAALGKAQECVFKGLLSMDIQHKVDTNGGIITMQDMRDLAVSAESNNCCHIVAAANDAQLGRFYAANGFISKLDNISDDVFELLDFSKIGKKMRQAEKGIFVGDFYILRDGELSTAPPCPKGLPPKPDYLFRLTLGLHPAMEDDRTVLLTLPASEEELNAAQERLGTPNWEDAMVLDYDGVLPNAAFFADLPMELGKFNELAAAVRDIPSPEKNLPKLKALLEQFEVQDISTAMLLADQLNEYTLIPEIHSAQEAAIDRLRFLTNSRTAELLLSHVNPYAYGYDIIREDNVAITAYGLLHRADHQPMLVPTRQPQKKEAKIPGMLSDDEKTILSAMVLQKGEAEAAEIFAASPESLQDYTILKGVNSYAALGRYYLANETSVSEDLYAYMDLCALGRHYENEYPGIFIGSDYVQYPPQTQEMQMM